MPGHAGEQPTEGPDLAELIVLVMLVFLVAGMAVSARTETQAWPALVNDVLSMLSPSAASGAKH